MSEPWEPRYASERGKQAYRSWKRYARLSRICGTGACFLGAVAGVLGAVVGEWINALAWGGVSLFWFAAILVKTRIDQRWEQQARRDDAELSELQGMVDTLRLSRRGEL